MTKDNSKPCEHPAECIKIQIKGDFKYEGGKAIDTQRIVYICTRCGKEIKDKESQIRS